MWSDVGLPLDDVGEKGLFDLIPALVDESASGAGRGDAGRSDGNAVVSPAVAAARKGQEEEEKRGCEKVRQPLASDRAAQSEANPFDEESEDEEDESGRAALTGNV